MSFNEIGKKLGISRQRAKQIHDKAISKLKSPRQARVLRPYLTD